MVFGIGSIGKLFVEIGADLKDFQSGLKQADKDLGGFQSAVQKHSRTFKMAGTAMVGASIGIGVAGLKMAADYEEAMREVNTMMGLGQDRFEELSSQVLQSAMDIGKSPTEMAQALYQVVSAGIPAGEAIQFLETSARAAVGGVTDIETAVDGLTTVVNAFGLDATEADRVADIMFATVKGGKTTFEELSASLFNVAPIAAASNISFEEVAAALATMTQQGVPTKVATTQLRQAMVALQKPTADMAKVIEELGYESGQAMLEEEGLAETLNILRDYTEGSNEELMKMFGSVEAGAATLSLTGNNADTFTDALKDMETASDDGGVSMEAFNEMNEGATRQFEDLTTQMQGVSIEIGTALMPALLSIVEAITPIITKIAEWVDANPGWTKALIIAAGILGGMLLTLGFLPGAIGLVTAALPILGAAFTLALGPIGLVAAAIAGIVAGFAWLMSQEGAAKGGATVTAVDPTTGLEHEFIAPGLAELTSFQHGGIVPGPRGMPIPIMAHGGEEYLGVGKTMSGVGGGGVRDLHIHTLAFMGSRGDVKKLHDLLREESRKDQRTMQGEADW